MEILGIGPLELVFIMLLAIIILGPKQMEKTGRDIGRGLARLVKSDTWKTVMQTSRKLKTLPNELMREAGIDEMKRTLDGGVILPPAEARAAKQDASPAESPTEGEAGKG
jgi:Sec-independent protein translocase protein TatA